MKNVSKPKTENNFRAADPLFIGLCGDGAAFSPRNPDFPKRQSVKDWVSGHINPKWRVERDARIRAKLNAEVVAGEVHTVFEGNLEPGRIRKRLTEELGPMEVYRPAAEEILDSDKPLEEAEPGAG